MSSEQYKIGTVTVTNGSNVLTFSGSILVDEVFAGNQFLINPDNVTSQPAYEVAANPVNDTTLYLTANYAGESQSGLPFIIQRSYSQRGYARPYQGDGHLADILRATIDKIDTDISGMATAMTAQDLSALLAQLKFTSPPNSTNYPVYFSETAGTATTPLSPPAGSSLSAGNALVTLHPGTSTGAVSYNSYHTLNGTVPSKTNGTKTSGIIDGQQITDLTNGVEVKVVYTAVILIDSIEFESSATSVFSATPSGAYLDDFDRTNGDVGSAWLDIPGYSRLLISSNAVTGANVYGCLYDGTFADDQYAIATVSGTAGHTAVILRGSTTEKTLYLIYLNPNYRIDIIRYLNSVETTIAGYPGDVSGLSPTKIRGRAVGTTIYADVWYANAWHNILQATDSSITSGPCGAYIDGGGIILDWEGGNI